MHQLSNKPQVLSALIDYHVMVKVKAEMDQSFETFKFMQMLKTNTEEWQLHFMAKKEDLTAGI